MLGVRGGEGGGDGAVREVGVCFCVGGAPEVFHEFLVGAGGGEGGGEEEVVLFWEAGCGVGECLVRGFHVVCGDT